MTKKIPPDLPSQTGFERQAFPMKLKSYLRRAAAGVLCLLICAGALSQNAFAAERALAQPPITSFTDGPDYSFTIQYKPHWDVGVTFRMYKVAAVDRNVKFTPEGLFKRYFDRYHFDLNTLDEKYEWDGLADALKKVVLAGGVTATKTGTISKGNAAVTDKGSYAELTFSGLYPGLYLVTGDSYEWKDSANGMTYTYTPNTYLVCIPNWSYNDNTRQYEWTKNVVADARNKASFVLGTTQSYEVFKVWNDNNNAAHMRPENIQVILYKDGYVYQAVTLSAANKWRYYWSNLPVGTYWVQEVNTPPRYSNTSTINYGSGVTGITNTYIGGGNGDSSQPPSYPVTRPSYPVTPPSYPVTPPSYPVTPPSSPIPPSSAPTPPVEIDDPDVPLGNVTPPPSKTDPPEEIELDDPDVPLGDLPQTGQLWWPVPMLIVAGIVLILIGIVRRRNGEIYDE